MTDVAHEPHDDGMVLSLWRGLVRRHDLNTMAGIVAHVAERHGLTVDQLKGRSWKTDHVIARQDAMWMMCKAGKWSTTRIGMFMNRDHSTVISNRDRHQARIDALDTAA